MIREVDIREISDGKLYRSGDMVRTDTGGCKGCSRCCREMSGTVILDPVDVYHLTARTGRGFDQLLDGYITLKVEEGLVLPFLAERESDGACVFLNEEGRCSIHDDRPGFCRLFPLGRYYDGDDFRYFLQIHECTMPRTKIRVRRWLQISDLPAYEEYIRTWHALIRRAVAMAQSTRDETFSKQISLYLLEQFFRRPWDMEAPFYPQFDSRAQDAGKALA